MSVPRVKGVIVSYSPRILPRREGRWMVQGLECWEKSQKTSGTEIDREGGNRGGFKQARETEEKQSLGSHHGKVGVFQIG